MKKMLILFMAIVVMCFSIGIKSNAIEDYRIIYKPTSTKEQIYKWATDKNASDLYLSMIDIGYDIAVEYGIDPTVMLSQTAIETGFGKFGGIIDESYHNTAGIKTSKGGSNSNPNAHYKFKSWEDGLTAQAQHLRLYGGYDDVKKRDLKDPRYFDELKGTALTVNKLSRQWASNSSYGNNINKFCREICSVKVKKNDNIKVDRNKIDSDSDKNKYYIDDKKNKSSILDRIKSISTYNKDKNKTTYNIKKPPNKNKINKNYILDILK